MPRWFWPTTSRSTVANSGWTLSFGGAPSGSGSITGGYGLTMLGNGTLILSGQNTYVTTINVAAGAVAVSGGTIGALQPQYGAGTSTIGAVPPSPPPPSTPAP